MAETCKACSKSWTEHLGVEPTCALLQEAEEKIKILEHSLLKAKSKRTSRANSVKKRRRSEAI